MGPDSDTKDNGAEQGGATRVGSIQSSARQAGGGGCAGQGMQRWGGAWMGAGVQSRRGCTELGVGWGIVSRAVGTSLPNP